MSIRNGFKVYMFSLHAVPLPLHLTSTFSAYTTSTHCVSATHNALPHHHTYCAFDSLWEQKPLVDCVDGVVGFNIALPLQQDRSSVQSIIGPEHREPAFFVAVDQGPACRRQRSKRPGIVNRAYPSLSTTPTNVRITHQLMAEAPLWRGSREGW